MVRGAVAAATALLGCQSDGAHPRSTNSASYLGPSATSKIAAMYHTWSFRMAELQPLELLLYLDYQEVLLVMG